MDVRLPDGTVIKGVPDGISRADLASKLKANGMNVPDEWMQAGPKTSAEGIITGDKPLPLPGTVPQPKYQAPGMADRLTGALEAPVSLATGAVAGPIAAWRHPFDAQAQQQLAERMTYSPRTETGQNIVRRIGEEAGPLMGAMPELQTMGAMRGAMTPPRVPKPPAMSAEDPVAQNVAAMRSSGIKTTPAVAQSDSKMGQVLQWIGGKIKTQQAFSEANQKAFKAAAKRDLGLSESEQLTPETLNKIRSEYGDLRKKIDALDNAPVVGPAEGSARPSASMRSAYGVKKTDPRWLPDDELKQVAGGIMSDQMKVWQAEGKGIPPEYKSLIDTLNQKEYKPSYIQAKVRQLRAEASDNFASGKGQLGASQKKVANALEDMLARKLEKYGDPDTFQQFQQMRTRVAKTYDVQDALNSWGDIAAGKIDPTSTTGELRNIGLAGQIPKLAQTPSKMAGTQALDAPSSWAAAAAAGSGDIPLLGTVMGGPLARKILMSDYGQRAFASPPTQPVPPGQLAQLYRAMQANPQLAARLIPPPPQGNDQ